MGLCFRSWNIVIMSMNAFGKQGINFDLEAESLISFFIVENFRTLIYYIIGI